MKTLFRLIVCVLLFTGWGLAALSLHVVRTPDEIPITLVPKERLGISDTYVDTRGWSMDDVEKHPVVVAKLINSGKADVLRHVVPDRQANDVASTLTDAVRHAIAVQKEQLRQQQNTTQPTTLEQATHNLLGMVR